MHICFPLQHILHIHRLCMKVRAYFILEYLCEHIFYRSQQNFKSIFCSCIVLTRVKKEPNKMQSMFRNQQLKAKRLTPFPSFFPCYIPQSTEFQLQKSYSTNFLNFQELRTKQKDQIVGILFLECLHTEQLKFSSLLHREYIL